MIRAGRVGIVGGIDINHLAIDLGANGGKLYLGRFASDEVTVEEVYRFDNRPVKRDGRFVWDTDHLIDEITTGIETADARAPLDSIAVDTWGLDFGLLRDGALIQQPYSYRDPAVSSTRDDLLERVSRREVFAATGINHWNTPNTLWQYHYLAHEEPELLDEADRLLMMPQLVSSLLGGDACVEPTIASTTQMFDPRERDWATSLLDELDLPVSVLPSVREPGTSLGTVSSELALQSSPELLLTASHDTAAAVAGLPLQSGAFLSTGTWFLLGLELDEPNLSDAAFEVGASNEIGVDGTVRFLKNLNGFFLLEECREAWSRRGMTTDYTTLVSAARDAPAFGGLVDPDDSAFGIEGEMPAKIREYCEETGQTVPGTQGEIVRCILESLVAVLASTFDELTDVTGERVSELNVGGGGVRNDLFCQLLADALAVPVVAGPTDATATGNLLMQARACGAVSSPKEGRRLVATEIDLTTYEPTGRAGWDEAIAEVAELRTERETA